MALRPSHTALILVGYEERPLRNAPGSRNDGTVIGRAREGKAGAAGQRAGFMRRAAWRAAASSGEAAARDGHHERLSGDDFVGAGAPVLPAGHLADPLVLVHRIGA